MRDSKVDDRSVRGYANDLSRVVILDAQSERALFERYRRNGDVEAKGKLVESGLRFVIKIAQAYARDLEHHKQLISAGNEGLLVAVDRYDSTRGTRFLSYATWWVTLYIREEIHRSTVVTIPMWRKKSLRKVRTAQERIRERHGREATPKELKKATGLSQQQLEGLIQDSSYETVSLDAALSVAHTESDTEASFIAKSGDRLVQYLISQLPIRDAFVLRAYYGFLSDPPMSLKMIAAILNVSSERVRQLKLESLDKLRQYLIHIGISSANDVYE